MIRKVKSNKLPVKAVFLLLFIVIVLSSFVNISLQNSETALTKPVKADATDPTNKSPIVQKVLVAIYDVHSLVGHTEYPYESPRGLSEQLEAQLEKSSKHNGNGLQEVDYQIVAVEEVQKVIPGKKWSDEKYFSIVDQFKKSGKNICQRVAAGEFDEVWVWSDRSGGLYEAIMIGPNDYETTWHTNGGPKHRDDCTEAFHIMGFNYERDVGLALHSFNHRVENTISHLLDDGKYKSSVTRGDNWFSFDGAWDAAYDPVEYGQSASKPQCLGVAPNRECWITPARTCGNTHFAPNGIREYDYSSPLYVTNSCIGWNPQKTNGETTYNCTQWGCDQTGYSVWWHQRMPGRCSGMKTLQGKDMPNWWWLITKGRESQPDWGCEQPLEQDPGTNAATDQRFGIGGSCNTADSLGLNTDWNYSWGNVTKASNGKVDLYNSREFNCLDKDPNNQVLLTVGKLNWEYEGLSQTDIDYWLNKAKADGYWNAQDQTRLDQIIKISRSSDLPGGKFRAPHRMQIGYIQIPYMIARQTGAYIQVGNEPDIYPYMPPEMFAVYYHHYYKRIKKYDPTAKVTVGSLGYPDYNHPFKDADTGTGNASDYPKLITYSGDKNKYPMYHIIAKAPEDKKEVYRSGAWLVHASVKYKEKYGTNIPVDFWGVHPYPWAIERVTNPNSGYIGRKFNNPDEAVNDSINQLEMFQKIIALPEINQSDKPVWVTEYSILHHKPITKSIFIRDQIEFQTPYLERFTKKAIKRNLAQKFFYYVASNPQLTNDSLVPGDYNIIGVPVTFEETGSPFPRNIQLPNESNIDSRYLSTYKSNKSKIGKITAFNFFKMQFKNNNTIQLMSENFHIFYLEYPVGEKATSSNTKWIYRAPSEWAGSIDKSKKLQAFNTYYDPIRNKMIQQVIAGNVAWSREATCTDGVGCAWPKNWTNWGKFMSNTAGAAGKDILGFDSRIMRYPNGDQVKQQTVVVEGNKVFYRVNKPNGKGGRTWTSWNARGVWTPAKATSTEIMMDVYGSNPYKSDKQHNLDMFTYDPVRNVYKYYSWEGTYSSYLMKYSNGEDNRILAMYKKLTNSFKDNHQPTIGTVDKNIFSKASNRLVFTVRGSDSGSSIVAYHYGVGREPGRDFSVLPVREYMSTSNEATIDLTDQKLNTTGTLYLNVFTEDAYGNTSLTKSIKIQ